MSFDAQHGFDQGGSANRGGRQLGGNVAQQDLHLTHRPGLAEELRGDIRNLVRLIQDHSLRTGQQIAEALVLERQIGQQQMVIHHDDVGGLRIAARLEYMTTRELRALLAETVLPRRGDARPHRGLLRQVGEFGKIAAFGGRGPSRHSGEQPGDVAFRRSKAPC